jgi:AcrR family transcriptional regulator
MSPSENQKIRSRITLAAFDLFAKQGYKGTSIQDVADAVNLKKPNVFYYFETKEALALAVIQHLRKLIHDYLTAHQESDCPTIKCLLTRIGANSLGDDPIQAWSTISSEMASSNPMLQLAVKETLNAWHEQVAKIVMDSGTTEIEEANAAAWTIISIWQGASSLERDAGSADLKAQGVKLVAEFLEKYQ